MIPIKVQNYLDRDYVSHETITNWVKRNGYKKLGYGAYTETYGHPDYDFVIKVNNSPDPAAFKFYSMIYRNKSKYFPHVHRLKSFVNAHGDYLFVAVIEKLHPLDMETWKLANDDGKKFTSWLATYADRPSDISIKHHHYRKMARIWSMDNPKEVEKILSISLATANFAELDLHVDNLMVRLPQGDVVLNDPVATLG